MGKKRKLAPKSETEPSIQVKEEPQKQSSPEVKEEAQEQSSVEVKEEPQQHPLEDIEEDVEEEEEVEEEMDAEYEETDNAPDISNSAVSETAPVEPAAQGNATTNAMEGAGADDDDEEEDDDTDEPVSKLLEPFTKEQLIDLLREAADKHSDVLDRIRQIANVDPVHRKIFVHGLGWDTKPETLTNVFKEFGEIEDFKVVCDKISGKAKGYGFILFKHRSGAQKALKQPQKRIGNRMTACQLASAGPVPPPAPAAPPVSEYTLRKIYVSNVSADIDPQKLLSFFGKYGEIEEGPLGLDKQTGKFRGFTLFVYKSAESAKKALEDPHKTYEGHILHCQKAVDGPKPNKPFHHYHQPGGHGSHFSRNEVPNFVGAMGNQSSTQGPGHLMAPSAPAVPFNQGAPQALNPAIGQAITALLASQGAGLGLTNLLGTLGSTGMGPQVNQTGQAMVGNASHGMQGGYGNQPVGNNISSSVMGPYVNQTGYPNPQIGQANAGRSHQGAGHMGGYMGH